MKYTSIVNYYKAVIFYHNVKGLPVARWLDNLLSQTFKGINNSNPYVDNSKDPMRPEHLDMMFRQVNMDSYFFFSHPNLPTAIEHIQHNLNHLNMWCKRNKVTINCKKTKYCIFGMKSTIKKSYNIDTIISLNGIILDRVCSYKYLGFILDD